MFYPLGKNSEKPYWGGGGGGGGNRQMVRWLLVFHIETNILLFIVENLHLLYSWNKVTFLIYFLIFYQKYFEIHFTSEERDFMIIIICDSNISGNDDCVESKPLLLIYCVEWRNIKQLFSCFQIKVLKHKLRISIHFIFRHCFMLPFSPLSHTVNNLKCYACRFLCKNLFLRITARRETGFDCYRTREAEFIKIGQRRQDFLPVCQEFGKSH